MPTSNRSKRSKETNNELQKIQKKTDESMNNIYPPIINDVTNKEDWDEVSKEVKDIFNANDYRGSVKGTVLAGSVAGTVVGLNDKMAVKDTKKLTDYYLQTSYEGDKLSKRLRLNANEAERIISDVVKKNLEFGTNWKTLAKEIGRKTNTVGDVSKVIIELGEVGEKYIKGALSTAEVKSFKSLVKKAQKQVDRLAPENAPTTPLKNAYQKVINSVLNKDTEVLKKSLTLAFDRKIDYNNQRVSRTELARSYDLSFHRGIEDDPDIVGYRFLLSPAHPRADQCDLCASVNNGVGPGIYKKGDRPRVPVHPHCLCMLEPYVDLGKGEPKKYTDKAAKEYLNDLDDKERGRIIGVSNAKYKSSWQKGLEDKGVSKESWPKRIMLPKYLVEGV